MKLIYINSDNSSVMEAQVLSLLQHYRNVTELTEVTLLQGYKNDNERKSIITKLSKFNLTVIWFKAWPGYTIFRPLALHSIGKVLDNFSLDKKTIIHVRGEIYGSIIQTYLRCKKQECKLLIDFRGLGYEEVRYYRGITRIQKWNKSLLFYRSLLTLKENVQITVVSSSFRDYLISYHDFQTKNIVVHPNIADGQFTFDPTLRQSLRKQLGFEEGQLVAICSTGGGAVWQRDVELITPLIKLGVQIINLSSKRVNMPGVINKLVSFDQMPSYLAAADFAILWRDGNIIHKIASPSKFSEFACMGLFVIHNGTVGIATDYINTYNAGIILDTPSEINNEVMSAFRNYDRANYSSIGRSVFGVEFVSESYVKHYKVLIENS